MARTVIRPGEQEVKYFHANYIYMWKKLNTAPYYVSGFGETPHWIRETELLPSYVNLSKCMNPDFVPSLNIVNKIVQFYNANISPAVDTYTYLHEYLADSDRGRTALACSTPTPWCGLYYCYYYSEAEDAQYIRGALLDIFEDNENVRARLFMEITDDNDLTGRQTRALLEGNDLTPEAFTAWRNSLPLSRRLQLFYSGAGRIDPGMMLLQLRRMDRAGSYLTLFMPLDPGESGRFIGSLGMASLIGEDRSLQFFRMGFERADHPELKPLLLGDNKLKELLALRKGLNERISMSPADNTTWTNYMVFHSAGY